MTRPNRNDVLMQTAAVWSQRSTCSRLHVGAVLSRQGRIISVGYNGPASGLPPCDHSCDCGIEVSEPGELYHDKHLSNCRTLAPCDDAIHAEANAIAWAARDGIHTNASTLHVTHMPCAWCAKFIINAGITEVRYSQPYRDSSGVDLLRSAGIPCTPYVDSMG